MKMRLTFILIACMVSHFSISQASISCQVMDAVLKYDKAIDIFLFKKNEKVPIVFIDVHSFLNDCNFTLYYGRKVQVVHDSSYLRVANKSNITVMGYGKTGGRFKVSLFYKGTNAFYTFAIKRKGRKLVVVNYNGGYF